MNLKPRIRALRLIFGHNDWFSFTLEDRHGETAVQFVQQYAQDLSDETYGTYNFNWGYYFQSLKLYCETGTGTPFVPPPG